MVVYKKNTTFAIDFKIQSDYLKNQQKMTNNIRFEALKLAWAHEPKRVEKTNTNAKVIFAQHVFTREKMKEYHLYDQYYFLVQEVYPQ